MSRRDSSSTVHLLWLPWVVLELAFAWTWLFGPVPLPVKVLVVAINVAAFVMYKVDKGRAIRGEWRIPEKWLFAVTLCGGMMGADWARKLFRHKTRKLSFSICMLAALMVQLYAMLIIAGAPVLPWQVRERANVPASATAASLHNTPHHHYIRHLAG